MAGRAMERLLKKNAAGKDRDSISVDLPTASEKEKEFHRQETAESPRIKTRETVHWNTSPEGLEADPRTGREVRPSVKTKDSYIQHQSSMSIEQPAHTVDSGRRKVIQKHTKTVAEKRALDHSLISKDVHSGIPSSPVSGGGAGTSRSHSAVTQARHRTEVHTPPSAQLGRKNRTGEGTSIKVAGAGRKRTERAAHQAVKMAERPADRAIKPVDQAAKATAKASRHVTQAVHTVPQKAIHTGRAATKTVSAAAQSAIKATQALAAAIAAGGSVALVFVVVLCLAGLLIASPFGIFFSDGGNASDAVAPAAAVAQINSGLADRLSELQAGGIYDHVEIQGQPPAWVDVLAVFAVKTAGTKGSMDVVVLDPDRVEQLRTVFWNMIKITTETETVDVPASGNTPARTETVLTITITPRTTDDMRVFYNFTDDQNKALDDLLTNTDMLTALAGDLTITSQDAKALLAALPADLSPERRAVVETACQLVDKVNYFWGGKSLKIGWDDRWGQIRKVTAEGSSTTGTFRPYGMDCSGFVDWVFYNMTNGKYIIGHGGGAHMQHTYCTAISWDEAIPGDLVFYPDDEHVGIVGGRDSSGNLLIIHCASGANNVVITGKNGFTSIARPNYYTK